MNQNGIEAANETQQALAFMKSAETRVPASTKPRLLVHN